MSSVWKEVESLQRFVLAGDTVTREEFFAEPEEDQQRYLQWLRAEARDVRREAKFV